MSRRTIGLREGLAGLDDLVPSRSSDSLWWAGHMHADFIRQLNSVSSETFVRLAFGLSEQCVKKQCVLAGSCFGGCMALNLRLSVVRTGVARMGKDYLYGRKGRKTLFLFLKNTLMPNIALRTASIRLRHGLYKVSKAFYRNAGPC